MEWNIGDSEIADWFALMQTDFGNCLVWFESVLVIEQYIQSIWIFSIDLQIEENLPDKTP